MPITKRNRHLIAYIWVALIGWQLSMPVLSVTHEDLSLTPLCSVFGVSVTVDTESGSGQNSERCAVCSFKISSSDYKCPMLTELDVYYQSVFAFPSENSSPKFIYSLWLRAPPTYS